MKDADKAAGGTNPTEIRASLTGQALQEYIARSMAYNHARNNQLMDDAMNRFGGGNVTNQQRQQFRNHADAQRNALRDNVGQEHQIHQADRAAGGGMAR